MIWGAQALLWKLQRTPEVGAAVKSKTLHLMRLGYRRPTPRGGAAGGLVSHFPIIQNAAPKTQWRFLDFCTAIIQNPNTREAYARAVQHFFTCCHLSGVTEMGQIKPFLLPPTSPTWRPPAPPSPPSSSTCRR